MRLKRTAPVSLAAVAMVLVAAATLYASGVLPPLSGIGLGDTPIKEIVGDPASYDGKNVTVIGSIGSRETATHLRSSLTIKDAEGYYIDLLEPVPSWLGYELEMPYIIIGLFTHYEYSLNGSQGPPIEEGYGLIPATIDFIFNFVH